MAHAKKSETRHSVYRKAVATAGQKPPPVDVGTVLSLNFNLQIANKNRNGCWQPGLSPFFMLLTPEWRSSVAYSSEECVDEGAGQHHSVTFSGARWGSMGLPCPR